MARKSRDALAAAAFLEPSPEPSPFADAVNVAEVAGVRIAYNKTGDRFILVTDILGFEITDAGGVTPKTSDMTLPAWNRFVNTGHF